MMHWQGWKTGFKNAPRYTPPYYQRLGVTGPPPTEMDLTIAWVAKKQAAAATVQESLTLTAVLAAKKQGFHATGQESFTLAATLVSKKQGFAATAQESFTLDADLAAHKQAFAGSVEEVTQTELTIAWVQKKAAVAANLEISISAGASPSGGMVSKKKFPGYDRVVYPEPKVAQKVEVHLTLTQRKASFFSGLVKVVKLKRVKVHVPINLKATLATRKQGMSAVASEQVLDVSLRQRSPRIQAVAVQVHTVEFEAFTRRHSFHARGHEYPRGRQEVPEWIRKVLADRSPQAVAARRQESDDEEALVMLTAASRRGR
jgi:hypothetical protein